MIKCRIRLGFAPGIAGIKLTGLFASTCDAVTEALAMYPLAQRISVIVLTPRSAS